MNYTLARFLVMESCLSWIYLTPKSLGAIFNVCAKTSSPMALGVTGPSGVDDSSRSNLYIYQMAEIGRQDTQSNPDGTALAESLLARCKTLLSELEAFRTFVDERAAEQEPVVDIRKFQSSVNTELKSLHKVNSNP